ncbi:hypothetical protein BRADO0317 [Bradyrhizobium sp. ORS 278]|nr:hypothetical protein BRADO0317 [Bradyrhizobium sp. ORS 278]
MPRLAPATTTFRTMSTNIDQSSRIETSKSENWYATASRSTVRHPFATTNS